MSNCDIFSAVRLDSLAVVNVSKIDFLVFRVAPRIWEVGKYMHVSKAAPSNLYFDNKIFTMCRIWIFIFLLFVSVSRFVFFFLFIYLVFFLSRTSSLCACFSVLFFQFISSTLNKNKKKYASFGKPKLIHPCSNYLQSLNKLKSNVKSQIWCVPN